MQNDATGLEVRAALTSGQDTWHTKAVAGLPALRMADGPHGLRRQPEHTDNLGFGGSLPATCFPPAVGLASSWNPDLVERVGRALGTEARSFGVHVLLGPGMNIKRSPLCGRNFEYFSEDPCLTGVLAAAMVRGVQSQGVAATPKHFAVNNQETDRMRVSAQVSERALREIYLRAFEHVVTTESPWAVMTAYNRINGTFASEHPWLLTEVLREEWGFDGLVMSDWGAVDDRVAAVAAGLDLEMPPSGTDDQVVQALRTGVLPVHHLDRVEQALGTLAGRVTAARQGEPLDEQAHAALSAEAAAECPVLLKNERGLLPLGPSGCLALIGPFLRAPRIQGGGSSRVRPTAVADPYEELRRAAGPDVELLLADGCLADGDADEHLVAEAVAAASRADTVVLFLGLPESWESEGYDRASLDLPPVQVELLRELARLQKPTVVVLTNGGVVTVSSWQDDVDAILETWLLGQGGPAAVADLLFGHASHSGRLAESIPHRVQDTPSFLHFPGAEGRVRYSEDVYVGYRYYETVGLPVSYPFGHGLTYSDFSYTDLVCTPAETGGWSVEATISNVGGCTAAETVQLYIGVRQDAPTRPARELRAFTKVLLPAGASKRVSFELSQRDVATWSESDQCWRVLAGEYEVLVAASVQDIRLRTVIRSDGDGRTRSLQPTSTLGEWRTDPVGRVVLAPLLEKAEALLGERSEALLQLAQHVPLVKMVDWKVGLTHETVDQFVRTVAELRRAAPGPDVRG